MSERVVFTEVYREYNPMKDEILYTVRYETPDGTSGGTHEFSLKHEDLEELTGEPSENFIHDMIVADMEAKGVISKEETNKMREVPRDDKWAAEREANDKRRDDYAVTDAADAAATQDGFEAGVELGIVDANIEAITAANAQPSETELVIVALLMRLYDINMALLSHVDKPTADSIYEAHENGGTFNPSIFIPTATEIDTDS